jgi:carboxypeptidase PM20D1
MNTNHSLSPELLKKISDAVKIQTISEADDSLFRRFQAFIAESFPSFHQVAEAIPMGPRALVYRWPGKDKSLLPALFLSHYDVVPVEPEKWTCDPFSGEVRDGYLYGRGTLDTKTTLIWTLEAAEKLSAEGFSPERDIWFAFGGDEEISGISGAKEVAGFFRKKNIHFTWAIDEGSIIADGLVSSVKTPLALISVEEKGYLDVELSVAQESGHASRPPDKQAGAILGRALMRISKKPFPWQLEKASKAFLQACRDLSTARNHS